MAPPQETKEWNKDYAAMLKNFDAAALSLLLYYGGEALRLQKFARSVKMKKLQLILLL